MTYDEYMKMLMAEQIVPWSETDPYAPEVPYGYGGGALIAPALDKEGNVEPYSLKTQAAGYNALQDWANLNSDPAILGGLFGETPRMSKKVYTPLSPDFTMLMNVAKQGESTVEGMIANEIMNGGSASSAVRKIKALADPESPSYDEAFAELVPMYTKDELGETKNLIDEGYLKDIGNQYQQAYLSVPISAETGKPNFEIDPETGQPSFVKEELTPLGQWYEDTGTPLPTDTYDPDLLTLEHVLEMERTAPERQTAAEKRLTDLAAMRRKLLSEGLPPPAAAPRVAPTAGGPVPGRERTPQRGGIADDLERLTQHPVQSVTGFVAAAPERLGAIPGALDRNIGNPVENVVGGIAGKVSGFFGGGGGDEEPAAPPRVPRTTREAMARAGWGPSSGQPLMPQRPVDYQIGEIEDRLANPERRGSVEWGPWGEMNLSYEPPQGYLANKDALRQAASYMGRSAGPAPEVETEGPQSLLSPRAPAPAPGMGAPTSSWARGRAERRSPISFAQVQSLLTPGVESERERKLRGIAYESMTQRQLAEFARRDQLQAAYNQQVRQKMVEQLAAQGHTPYRDTMAQRRALAQYGGFGA